jgi:UDP-N-acetylmuramyl pentapeptide synthase
MKMTLSEIAQAIGAVIPEQQATQFQETVVTSIAIDSRKAQADSLFAPLKDQRDGHDFVENAKAAGAVATFWQTGHPNRPSDLIVIEVDDVLTAVAMFGKILFDES